MSPVPSPTPRSLRDLVGECLELEAPARGEFLDRAVGHDPALRSRAQRLVDAHLRAHQSGFLEPGVPGPGDRLAFVSTRVLNTSGAGPADLIGSRIGNYRIRALVGSGGMGSVYEAAQESPRRIVALKIMRTGILSPTAMRRFEYEAQVLARLRHSGIAQVYEAGTHVPDAGPLAARLGLPFFVMELVPEARTITEFAQAHGLDLDARLGLFVRVCEAVQHAHQKGIIHRDLKPSNILVDAYGQPKIIDFGVARIHDPDGEGESAIPTMQTRAGQLIGTLQYMSPEQCGPDSSDIDVRSDVYSLGVVLYELLTGRPPYAVAGMPLADATRVIRETPAARLSSLDASLRGDIEVIAAKALEKDRTRRYQSASDLAADIGLFLAGERISARPASVVYQLRSMARRHRATVIAVIAVAAAIVMGLVGTSIGFYRATRERDRAMALQLQARDEARRAVKIASFLKSTIAAADPNATGLDGARAGDPLGDSAGRPAVFPISGGNLSAADLLSAASKHLEIAFADEPLTRAEMETTIGSTLFQFGRFVEAAEMLRDATEVRTRLLGPTNEYTLESRRGLAMAMQNQGLLAESLPLFEENFRTREPGLVAADIPAIIAARDLTNAYSIVGRSGDALALITRTRDAAALRLGPSHELTNRLTVDVASHLWNLGRTDEAITSARAAVALLRAEPGESAPGTTTAMWQLARMARRSGSLAEAEELLRAAIGAIRVRHGDSPAPPLLAQVELLFTLRRLERYEETASLARSILAATTTTYGPDSHRTVRARASLARTLMYVPGSTGEAVSLATAAADQAARVLASDDPNAWIYRAGQAEAMRRDRRPAEALVVLGALSGAIAATEKDPGTTVRTMIHQYTGLALMDLGRNGEAEKALMEAWAIIEPEPDVNSEHRIETARALATLAGGRGDSTAAEMWKGRAGRNAAAPKN